MDEPLAELLLLLLQIPLGKLGCTLRHLQIQIDRLTPQIVCREQPVTLGEAKCHLTSLSDLDRTHEPNVGGGIGGTEEALGETSLSSIQSLHRDTECLTVGKGLIGLAGEHGGAAVAETVDLLSGDLGALGGRGGADVV